MVGRRADEREVVVVCEEGEVCGESGESVGGGLGSGAGTILEEICFVRGEVAGRWGEAAGLRLGAFWTAATAFDGCGVVIVGGVRWLRGSCRMGSDSRNTRWCRRVGKGVGIGGRGGVVEDTMRESVFFV